MRSITFPGFPPKILITFLLRRSTCLKGGRGLGVVNVAIFDSCIMLEVPMCYRMLRCYNSRGKPRLVLRNMPDFRHTIGTYRTRRWSEG